MTFWYVAAHGWFSLADARTRPTLGRPHILSIGLLLTLNRAVLYAGNDLTTCCSTCVCGSRTWNRLLTALRPSELTPSSFKHQLDTHLFSNRLMPVASHRLQVWVLCTVAISAPNVSRLNSTNRPTNWFSRRMQHWLRHVAATCRQIRCERSVVVKA